MADKKNLPSTPTPQLDPAEAQRLFNDPEAWERVGRLYEKIAKHALRRAEALEDGRRDAADAALEKFQRFSRDVTAEGMALFIAGMQLQAGAEKADE